MSLADTMSRVARFTVVLALLVPGWAAHAEPPWFCGVDEASQHRARAAYDNGIRFLKTAHYSQAARAFRLALDAWDHSSAWAGA